MTTGTTIILNLKMNFDLSDSARLRGGQPAHDIQTGRGRSSQSPAEGVRRTPRPETGAVRQTVDGRQTTSVDGPSQFHHGHCALHRTTERRECFGIFKMFVLGPTWSFEKFFKFEILLLK